MTDSPPSPADLRASADHFGTILAGVAPDRYHLPTPCTDWNVEQLIDHVLLGNRWAALVLGGAPARTALGQVRAMTPAADRRDDWRACVEAQQAAFAALAPDEVVEHLVGPIRVDRFLAMRTADIVVHSWDLARAVGADDTLPPDLVRAGLAGFTSVPGAMAAGGQFGDGAAGAPQATTDQERLLHLTGRRP